MTGCPSPALFIHLPAKVFPSKLAPSVPNDILRNPPFYSLASFWIVLITPFNNKPDSSRNLAILIMSFISSFDMISVVDEGRPDPKIFLCIPASAADAAAVYPNGIKMLFANGLITFFINGNPVFGNGPRILPRNPPDCIILDIWIFDSLISNDDLLAKV